MAGSGAHPEQVTLVFNWDDHRPLVGGARGTGRKHDRDVVVPLAEREGDQEASRAEAGILDRLTHFETYRTYSTGSWWASTMMPCMQGSNKSNHQTQPGDRWVGVAVDHHRSSEHTCGAQSTR